MAMRRVRRYRLWFCALAVCFLCGSAVAAEHRVTGDGAALTAAVAAAAAGDTLVIEPGLYRVNLVLDKPVILQGTDGAMLDGGGEGDVIRVRAPDVTVRHLTIQRSGVNLTKMNSGIFVERSAARVRIEDNFLDQNGFGIWLDTCEDAKVYRNRIHGTPDLRSQDRGNGIHLFNVKGADVAGNEIWEARDGIYIDTSNGNVLRDNHIHHLRYGIHYMYSHHNQVIGNRSHDNRTGYALMQSNNLTVIGNSSERDGNYGILMNYITHSRIENNIVRSVASGRGFITGGEKIPGAEGKAIFIYNSLYNDIRGNLFADSEIGIHLTAGSEDNTITGNAFVGNHTQVKYVANREQEWSREGRGNFWSDYLGWDLNADGVGDRPYEPNDGVDKLLWKYPLARMLMNSPAVETLRWVQVQFPVLKPPGVRDSAPLMKAPATPSEEG